MSPTRLPSNQRGEVPPLARVPPSGLKQTEATPLSCPARERRSLPVRASHSLTVRSEPPLATVRPSELKHTERTCFVCPRKAERSWPLRASHSLTVPSALPLARV